MSAPDASQRLPGVSSIDAERRPVDVAWLVRIGLAVVVVAAAGLAFSLAWQRAYQVDEVESIHAAYAIASGKLVYRDFWQGHHPLLYVLLAPLLPLEDPVVAFRIARLFAFGLFLSTVGLSGLLARRLGAPAGLAMALLLLHSTFVERGLEVRPDTLMTPLVMLALLIGTNEARSLRSRFLWQALVLGVAFVATQKAAIASVAFGLVWLHRALIDRRPSLVVAPSLVWTLPWLGMLAVLAGLGALDDYARFNLFHPGESLQGKGGAASARFSALGPLFVEGLRNPVFVLAALGAGGVVLFDALRGVRSGREEAPAVEATETLPVASAASAASVASDASVVPVVPIALVGAVWLAGLFAMPFPYPYSHVGALPPIAVTIAVVVARGVRQSASTGRREGALALACALLLLPTLGTSVPRIARERGKDASRQLHVLERVQALTEPTSPVFDLVGLYFRPDAYPVYLMTSAHYARYRRGDYPPIAPWLREHGLDLFVVDYRVQWLEGEDRAFLQSNFVRVEPNLFLSGCDLDGLRAGESRRFEVTRAGEYRFDGDGALRVDGRPFMGGRLERGVYALSSDEGIARGRLVSARAPARPDGPMVDVPLYAGFD